MSDVNLDKPDASRDQPTPGEAGGTRIRAELPL